MNRTLDFFSRRFQEQVAAAEYSLNPFEQLALPYVRGSVLDLGCGLGNLSIAAARRGHVVTAVDACPLAVADLLRRAAAEGLPIQARLGELSHWRADSSYGTVVAIGLLMFFPTDEAHAALAEIRRAVEPGGVAVVNVLIEGTTFMDMFEPTQYCLFAHHELLAEFAAWKVLEHRIEDFPAGEGKVKRFATLIAERPGDDGELRSVRA
jgi:tellurite methyltransferase